MRRTLRLILSQCLAAGLVLPLSAAAQDTRGRISGTVRDASGVVPGAAIKITNTDTSVSQNLTTNASGYYEASFLNPGTYAVSVQMPGYKAVVRDRITLGVGEQLTVPFTLEVGQLTEEVVVTAESPLIDTTSIKSAARFDTELVENLPMFSNMPITLARFAPSTSVNDQQTQVSQGYVDNTSLSAGSGLGLPLGGTQPTPPSFGGNNYTLDGANNNGSSRRIAASPNSDMIQEMRVESSNFDAGVGHGLGLQISMMTRAGTNRHRGTANYQFWTNKFNALTEQQKLTFDDRAKSEFEKGRSHNLSLTSGGPVRIPGIVDGRGKLFYFGNYSYANDAIPGKIQGALTVPANAKHLRGDFSDLLLLPNPAQYQIYDPLTTRPDPSNPSRMIRDPFPNNVIPTNRIFNADGSYKNPLMALYAKLVPQPNQNFVETGQQPTGNFYQGGQPDSPKSHQYGFRLDFNATAKDRLFFRTSGVTFLEYVSDWTYQNPDPKLRMNSADRSRYQWSYTGTWTRNMGPTVLDTSIATNRFNQIDQFYGLKQFKPTDVGLPTYLDDFCSSNGGCTLPAIGIGGYQGMGGGLGDGDTATHIQAQSSITTVKGRHTFQGGVDVRRAQRDRTGGGNRSGQMTFDRTYTRQFSDESSLTPSNLGLALAAFELGLPTSASINNELPSTFSNYWTAAFGQDTWRLGNVTVNAGLRFEYETGVREADGHMIVGWDPAATLAITDAAQAAYLASGLQTQAGMPATLNVRGGPIYAGESGVSQPGEAMWMPRASASYLLNERTVLKGGYGLYYDTLTAADYFGAQAGYSVTTTSTISDDLGRTFKWANPATGSASFDPFPVRADGSRWDPLVGDTLGVNTVLGGNLTTENGQRKHARQQRWRVSLQRQLLSNLAVEVAYTGAFNDRLPVSIRGDFLPEQYWDGSNARNTAANTFLTANVTNPYFINNFTALRTTNPTLYQRLASNPTFASATIQRQRLLRPFGVLTNLTYANLPIGESKAHSLEVQLNHRMRNGLSGFLSFNVNSVRFNRTVEEYEREPTLWQGSNDARPWRLAGAATYELPFGKGKPFLADGGVAAALAGNWQLSGTWEFQPGALLDWGGQNIFFYGDLDDIDVDEPTRERWFNIDAGFERDPAKIPAAFQKRAFPFRIDGVRSMALTFVNMSIQRSFGAGGGRTWQVRFDAQNLLNRQQWLGPTLNPTSTNFGRVTTVALNQMRFFSVGLRGTF
ncbi:MAG TPA: carboxypeptidase-like regulatory domain-containing protein [Vicinamibacterales bacterium]|nr:carboxypeptidase-like regulatory domain-containing protein [Vicinamibacterales bacterium]